MIYILMACLMILPIGLKFGFFKREFSILEMLAVSIISPIVAGLFFVVMLGVQIGSITGDTELLHGTVLSKNPVTKSCPSGWNDWQDDFCSEYTTREVLDYCTGTPGKDYVCYYKTQYHYDYDTETRWYLKSTFGTDQIARVNPRGDRMPPRYDKIIVGEPYAMQHHYTNWLLVPNNAFVYSSVTGYSVFKYPFVYDLYRTKLVIGDASAPYVDWNDTLRLWLRQNGAVHEINPIIILTHQPIEYVDAQMYAWKGGKKNDFEVFIGIDKDNKPLWIRPITFAKGYKNASVITDIESDFDKLPKDKALDKNFIEILFANFENYNRIHMTEFEYLKRSIELSGIQLVILVLLTLALQFAAVVALTKNELRD